MNPVYTEVKWRKGSVFKADAKAALKEIEALNKRHGGYAPDGSLVEHARNPESVLHNDFEWDDAVAGDKYRLNTEKKIKRSLVVVTEKLNNDQTEPTEIRLFQRVNVECNDKSKRFWLNTFDMLKDPEGREIIIETARKELNAFHNKYKALTELSDVLEPINLFLKK
tara:strand:+ start:5479 stop:5979 length:501 start_codon:yes stop_codon:yes gene_type:complete